VGQELFFVKSDKNYFALAADEWVKCARAYDARWQSSDFRDVGNSFFEFFLQHWKRNQKEWRWIADGSRGWPSSCWDCCSCRAPVGFDFKPNVGQTVRTFENAIVLSKKKSWRQSNDRELQRQRGKFLQLRV
jgi:hypothetical protein